LAPKTHLAHLGKGEEGQVWMVGVSCFRDWRLEEGNKRIPMWNNYAEGIYPVKLITFSDEQEDSRSFGKFVDDIGYDCNRY
jgi:hypothetical protein